MYLYNYILFPNIPGQVANDTVIADPLFTVPVQGGGQLCYEICGRPGTIFNLISDKCTSVAGSYQTMDVPDNGNIIRSVGIKAVDLKNKCHNIEVHLTAQGNPLRTLIDNTPITENYYFDGISVRHRSTGVRISVPNCDLLDLAMWVIYHEVDGQKMMKFVVTRGYNLAPTSHGLIGTIMTIIMD